MSSEVTADDVGIPLDFDVKALTSDFLDGLTDNQANYVRNMVMRRKNTAIYDKVMLVMKGKEQDIIEGLSHFPPVYVSPEIEIMSSIKVKFRNLITLQNDDAMDAANNYAKAKSPTEFQLATFLNRAFLAHAVETYNGEYLAGKNLNVAKDADEESLVRMLGEYRKARMSHLNLMPPSVVQVLVDANQVFQEFYDGVVSLRGTPEEIQTKLQRIADGVGKSTGPHTAGQKQT